MEPLLSGKEVPGYMYKVITRQYVPSAHDGHNALKDCKYLIDEEYGKLMSTLVRQYLLGEWKLGNVRFPTEM